MKTYGSVEVIDPPFLISALVVGVWSDSHPGSFTPGERAAGTDWIGDWVCPRTGVDDVDKRKIFPFRDSNSDP
jgi:hypothetical protein